MVRSKTRNLLANIHMAVKVSRFSSPSHIQQFSCNVSSLTILISNDLLSTTLRPKAIVGSSHGSATHLGLWTHRRRTASRSKFLLNSYVSRQRNKQCKGRSTDQTSTCKGSQQHLRTTNHRQLSFFPQERKFNLKGPKP